MGAFRQEMAAYADKSLLKTVAVAHIEAASQTFPPALFGPPGTIHFRRSGREHDLNE
jgi:hypothetical protein